MIKNAFIEGRIINTPTIQAAFQAAFEGYDVFLPALRLVLEDVLLPCLKNRCPKPE